MSTALLHPTLTDFNTWFFLAPSWERGDRETYLRGRRANVEVDVVLPKVGKGRERKQLYYDVLYSTFKPWEFYKVTKLSGRSGDDTFLIAGFGDKDTV